MKLKEMRVRLGYTQADVAQKMNTSQQTVARWEAGKTTLNVDQIRDLCLVLHCTAEALLGWKVEPEEWRESPFAIADAETPYGTLEISISGSKYEYPIDEKAKKSMHSQLERSNFFADRSGNTWLHSWTLDNKFLLINPAHVRKLGWLSDDVEPMPSFENPEVYKALEDFEEGKVAGEMLKACKNVLAEIGDEEVERLTSYALTVFEDGDEEWRFMDEDVANELHELMTLPPELDRHVFCQIDSEGYHGATFANLSKVAMFQFASDRFHRLTAPE